MRKRRQNLGLFTVIHIAFLVLKETVPEMADVALITDTSLLVERN